MSSPGRRVLLVFWAAFLAFVILFIGQTAWSLLLLANFRRGPAFPWCIPVMALVLWLLWRYLDGKWWPQSTSQARHMLLRANRVSRRKLALAFTAGLLAIIALAGYWIVFFQLVKTPPNALPDVSKFPRLTVMLLLAMSSLVSPIVEEAGFRGYCQKKLESEFAGPAAVGISSLLFMLAHTNHGWYWPKLVVYFLAGLVLGAIAYFADSILASIPVHILADATFFALIWPRDSARRLVTEGGADSWFWIHVTQALIFTALALLAFRFLVADSSRHPRIAGEPGITPP